MSDDNIELPEDWIEQGWTPENALEETASDFSDWGAEAQISAPDPADVEQDEDADNG